jgi:hypothetical protein
VDRRAGRGVTFSGAAPALVLGGDYNAVMANKGLARLMRLRGLPADAMLAQPLNLLRAVFAPGGLRGLCVDEAWLCGEIWSRACREAEHLPRLRDLLHELRPTLRPWSAVQNANPLPVQASRFGRRAAAAVRPCPVRRSARCRRPAWATGWRRAWRQ